MINTIRDYISRNKKVNIRPVFGSKEIDPNTQLPAYLEEFNYGEIRERYRALDKPTVCVIDNGANANHYDLKGNLVEYKDFVNEGNFFGNHGQHVTSVISGRKYGLSDNIPIAHYKALSYEGSGNLQAIRDALRLADKRGYRVISMSLGSDHRDPTIEKIIKNITKNNTRFVVPAAGNQGKGDYTDHPGAMSEYTPGVITVAAGDVKTTGEFTFASFNSRGANSITAQGYEVIGAGYHDDKSGSSKYMIMSGSSMAVPTVSCLIALAIAIYPEFELRHFWEAAEKSCIELDEDKNTQGIGFIIPETFLKNVERIKEKEDLVEPVVSDREVCVLKRFLLSVMGFFRD